MSCIEDAGADIVNIDENTKTFSDLTKEIEDAPDGSVINLTSDYVYDSGDKTGIVINKSITINGNNHKIDGNSQSRIFRTFEGNITLNNLILTNGFSNRGGAIYNDNTILLNNIIFKNNHADEGGAIFSGFDSTREDIQTCINNCIFDGNSAKSGASIYVISVYSPSGEDSDDDSDYNDSYDDMNSSDIDYSYDNVDGSDFNESYDDENTSYSDEEDYDDEDYEEPEILDAVIINDSIFKNTDNCSNGLIFFNIPRPIKIINATFANSTSIYGTAFTSSVGAELSCFNCSFVNLHADISGGAICGKGIACLFDNCSFINTSSKGNGGAICVNCNGGNVEIMNDMKIRNCKFINTQSNYAGSIAYSGSKLNISDTIFENSSAAYSGGAIYTILSEVNINNSTFKNSRLTSKVDKECNGGAIRVFHGKLYVNDTKFINNSYNAIYSEMNEYHITNCFFNNNTEAVRSIFPKNADLNNNNYTNDALAENIDPEGYYTFIVNTTGLPLNLVKNEIIVENLPSRFNSCDFGWISSVKDQSISGACWVFSTCGGIEAALLKATGIEFELSVNNIEKNLLYPQRYCINSEENGGYATVASEYLLSWYGAISADKEPFDPYGFITRPVIASDAIHLQDIIWFDPNVNLTRNDEIKRNILKYGAITTTMSFFFVSEYLNNETGSWYSPEFSMGNHAVCVVGWDDNYSADNFNVIPPGDGAWIIKNSYGPELYDHGYNYVSYYDKTFFQYTENVAFIFENTENYNKNYQTDISGIVNIVNGTYDAYKNQYTAIDDDFISAVGTYFGCENEEYTLKIYVNGKLKITQSGKAPFKGFHTVPLTKDIPIKKGDNFTVVMEKSSVPIITDFIYPTFKGHSLVRNESGWYDLSDNSTTASLKVYTKELVNLSVQINAANVNTVYNGGKYLTVTVKDVFGDALNGVKVTIKLSNGKTKTLTTNSKGQVKFLTNSLAPNTYRATVTVNAFEKYIKTTSTAKIVVKKATVKLTAKAKTFKKSVKTKKYTVTLKTNKNKAMKNTKVTLKVNGKTYTAKTNSKGQATFKITKLTKKGKFTATIKYAGSKYYNSKSVKAKITVK
ncbi:C1 family peptidase [Methanobrevibacter sp.]|uniref:C1 family peptidase n=1 Tax=Methanobrevibacter sp. TaxID=66852 RepID=UPI00388F3B96